MLLENVYRLAPFARSLLDFVLLGVVSFFFDRNVAGQFLVGYFWMYGFSYFASGYLTVKYSGGKATDDSESVVLKFSLLILMLCSVGVIFGRQGDRIAAAAIFSVASFLSVLDTSNFVQLEKKIAKREMLISSYPARLFSIIYAAVVGNFFPSSMFALCGVFLFKEVIGLLIFPCGYLRILQSAARSRALDALRIMRSGGSTFVYLIMAFVQEPLIRFAVALHFGPGGPIFYEFFNRAPRFLSAATMQLTRHRLFASARGGGAGSAYRDIYINIGWGVNMLAGLLMGIALFTPIEQVVVMIVSIVAASVNLVLSVRRYNECIVAGDMIHLISIGFLQVMLFFGCGLIFKSLETFVIYSVYVSSLVVVFVLGVLKGK